MNKTSALTNINHVANTTETSLPDIGFVYSHAKADGSYNHQDLPLHPLILDLCAIPCLQTYSGRAEVELNPFCVFQPYILKGGKTGPPA